MYSSSQPSQSTGASYISRASTPEHRTKSRHRSQNKGNLIIIYFVIHVKIMTIMHIFHTFIVHGTEHYGLI